VESKGLIADRELASRAVSGDGTAFEEIVRSHETLLRRVLLGLVADRHLVEDLLQEVFLIAYRRLSSYRGEGPLRTWLTRIAVREAIGKRVRWLGFWRRCAPLEEARLSTGDGRVESRAEQREELEGLLGILGRLPAREKAAIILHTVEGMSHGEIGEIMGCPSGTVGSLISRGRVRLGEAMGRRRRGNVPGPVTGRNRDEVVPAALAAGERRS
jgi:RNA polymerase sigma-70 factor (ECF subfamily)